MKISSLALVLIVPSVIANRGSRYAVSGVDNSERLLFREGVIDFIPPSICNAGDSSSSSSDSDDVDYSKNVIFVVGDGMGWEMVRAGAIARQVLDELEEMGIDTKNGNKDDTELVQKARERFVGRTLSDYYTEGKGSGLSWQNLEGYSLVTHSAPLLQDEAEGEYYAPSKSMLEGDVDEHDNGMSPLAVDKNTGLPLVFDPSDFEDNGGDMVLWNDAKGGAYPWDSEYFNVNETDVKEGFDKEFVIRHATDSAATASAYATGHKTTPGSLSVNLYEERVSTILEDAMQCGKAGGVVSSVPLLHATPGSFIVHSNSRTNRAQLQWGIRDVNPTFASGSCASRYQPSEEHKELMRSGSLSKQWTILETNENVKKEEFYNDIQDLDPDDDQHVLVCLGGDYVSEHPNENEDKDNLPYRGVDSSYSNRWCNDGRVILDPVTQEPVGVEAFSELCDHYTEEELKLIPHISTNVHEALKFLSKDDEGFFMLYEQGDIDWSAHQDHMDDMLGALLDMDESVQVIIDWITENGGWEKNALYVTADHDHYLTLNDNFPEVLAKLLIVGESYNITPENNSRVDAYGVALEVGLDPSKTKTEQIKQFSTWTDEDIENVGHFWGPRGSGGNGWKSHSARPVPIGYMGDDGCLEKLEGKGYQVLGQDVAGSPGKVDQVHVHACMMKNLFGFASATPNWWADVFYDFKK